MNNCGVWIVTLGSRIFAGHHSPVEVLACSSMEAEDIVLTSQMAVVSVRGFANQAKELYCKKSEFLCTVEDYPQHRSTIIIKEDKE